MFDITPILEKYNLKTLPITYLCNTNIIYHTTVSYNGNPIRCQQNVKLNNENDIRTLTNTMKVVHPLLPVSIKTLEKTHPQECQTLRKHELIPNLQDVTDILTMTMAIQPPAPEIPVEPK